MLSRVCLSLVLSACSLQAWCQVEPSATGGSGSTDDDSMMSLPPQVSGSFYPSSTGSQDRSNFLSLGVLTSVSYDDNVLTGETPKPIASESYSVTPSISLIEKTPRMSGSLSYSPGFIYYDPASDLNQVTQNAVADFEYRWTPRLTAGVQEVFQQNSTAFSSPYIYSGATISGSSAVGSPQLILPYSGQIMETTPGHLEYQFSKNSLIGASGYFTTFHFTDAGAANGLSNSTGGGGSVNYSRRLTRTQDIGILYQYTISKSNPIVSTTESHFGQAFYSIALGKAFTLSLTGGPEYSTTSAPGITSVGTWSPSGNASIGWHQPRVNVALSYSRAVSTGWGLLGAYTMDGVSINFGYQFSRRLSADANGNYGNSKNATPTLVSYVATGHTFFERAALNYQLSEHFHLVGDYSRLHQDYFGISAISNNPDADRVSLTLNYAFTRPLGR
jgi:hypothetical protein